MTKTEKIRELVLYTWFHYVFHRTGYLQYLKHTANLLRASPAAYSHVYVTVYSVLTECTTDVPVCTTCVPGSLISSGILVSIFILEFVYRQMMFFDDARKCGKVY